MPLGAREEQELLDEIKRRARELEEARKRMAQEEVALGEIRDLDAAITEAFATADKEHAEVLRLSGDWEALTAQLEPALREMDHLRAEADKKHAEYLELRQRADAEHAKGRGLLDEVEQRTAELRKLYEERREAARAVKDQVKEALDDPAKREASADEALRALLEKGRVSL